MTGNKLNDKEKERKEANKQENEREKDDKGNKLDAEGKKYEQREERWQLYTSPVALRNSRIKSENPKEI